jgi:hypothetical protein
MITEIRDVPSAILKLLSASSMNEIGLFVGWAMTCP